MVGSDATAEQFAGNVEGDCRTTLGLTELVVKPVGKVASM